MVNASATSLGPALPVLPPVPVGPAPLFHARGLAALIAALDDAVISYRSRAGDAIVVIVGGRVLDAIAAPLGRPPLVGLEALNALGPADPADLRAASVDRRLALALPSYWREADRLAPIPARWVDPAGVIEAMIQPGRRGTVVLRSADDLGIVLFDEGGLIAAYSRSRPEPGGLETLAGLMVADDTMIHGRLADANDHEVAAPVPAALPDPIERCRGEIVHMAQATLHRHAEPVIARFRAAPPTTQGLLLAAEEVREMQLRLITAATMASIADEAERIVRTSSRA